MPTGTRILRLAIGAVLVVALVAAGFWIVVGLSGSWGATPAETAMALPGDALLERPQVVWTHARTIQAPPQEVWPWIAQIGDARGGFYSFTFIEDRVGALTGEPSYQVNYENSNEIVPAWQNPAPGEEIIAGILKLADVRPGEYMLADSMIPDTFGWTWVWQVQPAADGQQTRLITRMRIQMPVADNSPASLLIGLGAFIMDQRMMNGIQARAAGWREPPYEEGLEIGLWFVALAAGLAGAVLFVARRKWLPSLLVAVAAVVVIFVLTFVQPPIWARVALDAALIAGVWWAWRATKAEEGVAVGT